ncbi:TolC family protein [Vulgatibacter sp.]|uniref:TolC family protein n=1 Tax=Vulgatibacter sp. TaxID=1971226 RepID=UPI003566ABBE
MKALLLPALLLLPGAAQAIELREAIETALRNDPELRALDEEAAAAGQARNAAERLLARNPVLILEGGAAVGETDSGFEYAVALEQPLELAGQQGARRDAAMAAADRARLLREARRNVLAAEVRSAFARVLAARERKRVAEQSADLAGLGAEAAEQRYEAGKGARITRNAALVERGRAARELATAVVELDQALAAFRALLGPTAEANVLPEGELVRASFPVEAQPERLLAAEQGSRPDLAAAHVARREAEAQKELAAAAAVPDLVVGGFFERELDTDRYFATVSIPLPLFDRNDAARAEARTELARARAALTTTERTVDAEMRAAAARLEAAGVAAAAWEAQVLEALDENVALVTEAFRNGDVDYVGYLIARREAIEGRLAWIDTLEELALAQAAYDRAIGRAAPR